MKKRVFIIHCWGGNPKGNWYDWLKKELEIKGFKIEVLEMPNTEEPEIKAWVNHLKKAVGKPDKDTYFIGHSIGCQTIMRYLEKINVKIGGVVFIAGWLKLANLEDEEVEKIAKPWLEKPIDFGKINKIINKLTVILSDNDPYGFVSENSRIFKEELGAKVIIEQQKGHFTKEEGENMLPSALKSILEIIK